VSTALIVGAALLGLLLAVLAVPVDVAFRFENVEAFSGEIAVGWLFGLARFRIRVPGERSRREHPAKRQSAGGRPSAAPRGRRANVAGLLRQATFRRRAYRFAKDLVSAARPRELRLRMRVGLGDPADTGRLWGILGPLGALAQRLPHAQVAIEPEFGDPAFEFQARGRLLLVPIRFLVLTLGFALSPASLRAWRTLRGRDA
jgi:hypothetical protein